jgi:hypothetical protein
MQSSIKMIIEEVKRLSNVYENRVPSVLLFETLFKAEEIHKQEIINAHNNGFDKSAEGWNGEYGLMDMNNISEEIGSEQYYQDIFKKD